MFRHQRLPPCLIGGSSAHPFSRRVPPVCREAFFEKVEVQPGDEAAMQQLHAFCAAFGAVLADIQAFLAAGGLDDPTKV